MVKVEYKLDQSKDLKFRNELKVVENLYKFLKLQFFCLVLFCMFLLKNKNKAMI